MSLRLTLRTLLSYLDDTLEPAQAKLIGAKVAESDQARELMERIKQVTRRRRLTTPPASGPGGMDPNTIAEYLDNEVTAEKAAEVEQICLASDVHLAEVAACHQILTLVLGEPALVPPSAKQRMYALVKGPEAIHSRKPARALSNPDLDLSSEIEPDQDETLRMGVPAVRSRGDSRNLWILIGGGVLAACLLSVAVWQLVHTNTAQLPEPRGETVIVSNDGKEKDTKDKETSKSDSKIEPAVRPKEEPKKQAENDPKDPVKAEDTKPTPGTIGEIKVESVQVKQPREVAYQPVSLQQKAVAKYPAPNIKEPSVLLQAKPDQKAWARVGGKTPTNVFSGRPLLSLPGSKNSITMESGLEIVLWGNLPEVTLDPMLESRIVLNANDQLDADLTLQRGRIIIRNKAGKPDALVRVRFENSTTGEENYLDITLPGDGSAVVVERFSDLDRNEPFYEDRKSPERLGPTVWIKCYSYGETANVRFRGVTYSVNKQQQPVLQWQSRQDEFGPPAQVFLPPWLKDVPAPKDDAEQKARKFAIKAHDTLAGFLETKPVDIALAEAVDSAQQAAQREITMEKKISWETFALWRQVIRCYAAIDEIRYLFDEFAQEKTPPIIRGLCMQTLYSWIGLARDNDYALLNVVQKNYPKLGSVKIMELFHRVSVKDAENPIKYQHLIEGLNNDLLPIRVLSHLHLLVLVPAGQSIPYDAIAPRPAREAAVRQWLQLIPPGQLPPAAAPMKKEKDKG